MRPRSQQTVRGAVAVTGVGYWSGRPVRVGIEPAEAGAGIVFERVGPGGTARIPVSLASRVDAVNRTALVAEGGRVEMVEHLLSALAGLGVDACVVRIDADELPGLDGSALAFVEAIDAVGLRDLGVAADPVVVEESIRVEDGDAWIEAHPPVHDGLSVAYDLDYGPGPIGRQSFAVDLTPASYRRELAAARTFVLEAEAERLRSAGLGLAATPRDLLVFAADGPVDNALRWPDECVRHKLLDLVGDLSLVGRPIHARIHASRSGHRLNARMADALAASSGRLASA